MKLPSGIITFFRQCVNNEVELSHEELVMCSECKYAKGDIFDRGLYCDYPNRTLDVDETDYCSRAVKRE